MSEEPLPPEILLDDYPPDIQAVANALRAVVMTAVPDAIERVRIGWRLIGYDVPAGRRTRYFAFVVPEPAHVHLGFEYGILMSDPQRLLHGAELKLRKVRYFTLSRAIPFPRASWPGTSRRRPDWRSSAALDLLRLRLLLRIRECWIVGDRVDPGDESVGGVPRTGYALELLNEIHAPSPEFGSALARNPGMPDE